MLAFARGLHVFIPQQLRREWKKSSAEDGDVVHLPEATALIVGVGGIGTETARLLAAFGVTVLATDARRTTAPDGVVELHRPEALDELRGSRDRGGSGRAGSSPPLGVPVRRGSIVANITGRQFGQCAGPPTPP